MDNTVLIAGASGVIGSAAVAHFSKLKNWRVIGISRRPAFGVAAGSYRHIKLDLTDVKACRDAAEHLSGVTHVVFAALFEKPGLVRGWFEHDQMQTNLAMMRNLMEPLLACTTALRHVSVLQGTKAYGAHVHRLAIPARERSPRDPHENFYWLQEDFIRAAQRGASWTFTIWRPQIVFGGAYGVAMNLIPVLGVYAALCRELGLPFVCPGSWDTIYEAVDADLIAHALAWAAESPSARNETFNITNGDVYVWKNVWPTIADAVGLAPAEGRPLSLAKLLPAHAEDWKKIAANHGLVESDINRVLGESHHYADLLFGYGAEEAPPSAIVSTIKLRQAGFGDCIDTEDMLRKWLRRLADLKVLPGA